MSKFQKILAPCIFLLFVCVSGVLAQSSSAALSGTIEDQNGAALPGVTVSVENVATRIRRTATTNGSGSFTIPLLPPGEYTVLVEREGFTRVQLTNIVLNVGDQKAVQVQLKVGDVTSTVDVQADASMVRTDGSVGTVIDRQFVQNIPLSGRSFQSLLELTPGVVITPAGTSQAGGQFSVNGQRTNTNYFTVDGVGANAGIISSTNGFAGQGGSGQLPGFTATGSTASLVSVDALQEFRIQTSSYSPEFGRQPGGQVSLVTRSGENSFSGTAFDYVRNEALDANDWFANRNSLPKPPTRQHQFGGTFSGPIYFPNFGEGGSRWYDGRNRTFFFFSYEGLRLRLPKATEISVPTLCFRGVATCPSGQTAAPSQFHDFLRAFPVPNGAELGSGFAKFAASYADPSRYDATALRVDHSFDKLTLFARVAYTPSSSATRLPQGLSTVRYAVQDSSSLTVGSVWNISKDIVNDLRANHTTSDGPATSDLDDFGGAIPLQTFGFLGRDPESSSLTLVISGVPAPTTSPTLLWGTATAYKQRQFNIVDTVSVSVGNHQFKLGVDFRRSTPILQPGGSAGSETITTTLPLLLAGQVQTFGALALDDQPHVAVFDNLSSFAQDTWRVNRRLTLSYGIRWEFVPPPHASEGPDAITLDGLDNPLAPNHLSVAPVGTPLWDKRYLNFAPRVGASYLLVEKPGRQLVVRGGWGIFYDLGLGSSAEGFAVTWPNVGSLSYPIVGHPAPDCRPPLRFPLPNCALLMPTVGSGGPSQLFLIDRKIKLPRTYQWNASVEQSIGASQTLSLSYVAAAGRELLSNSLFGGVRVRDVPYVGSSTTVLGLQRNLGYSNYEAFQAQFQRRLSRGVQGLISYTLARSRDTESADLEGVPIEAIPPGSQYGYSSFDVRHNLTAAATFQIPGVKGNSFLQFLTENWGVDTMFRARTGFPINVTTNIPFPPLLTNQNIRPNVVPGQPFWIDDPNAPGGRRLNLLAFSRPANGTVGDLPKGIVRGFGAKQLDVSLRRAFPLTERVRLDLRLEAFNIFNWPSFANPNGSFNAATQPQNFGASTQMLNRGLGGLNALYQIGGPRSMQASVRLTFK